MKLIALKLRNFKGKKELDINLDGQDATIFGNNATGKTTIKDGLSWLLFGKDSLGRAQFDIKTLDANNQPYPKLDHSVEGTFKTDSDRVVTLKKVLKEKYTTPRGKSAEVFDGHTTSYFIDGAPKKKKDYTTKVAELTADETKFQLLTSPGYFPSMSWQKQRELLLDICGGVTNSDIIAANSELADLPNLMEERTLDEFKAMVVSQRRDVKKNIDAIPGRVDEATRAIPDLESDNSGPVIKKLKKLSKQLNAKEEEISSLRNGAGVANKKLELSELDGKIAEAKNAYNASMVDEQDIKREALVKERDSLEIDLDDTRAEVKTMESHLKGRDEEIKALTAEKAKLVKEWEALQTSVYDCSADYCPTCQQPLQENEREAARKRFNEHRATRLNEITENGNAINSKINNINKEIQADKEVLDERMQSVDELSKRLEKIKSDLRELSDKNDPTKFEDTGEYAKLIEQRGAIEQEIASLQAGTSEAMEKASAEKAEIEEEIGKNNAIVSSITLAQIQRERIAELEAEQKSLAAQMEGHDRSLWLCELFEKTRAETLQDQVSSHFNLVTFKLFRSQINEGIQPTCEAMVDGVPYSNLNSAARVQAGLDIINTLSNYYGFYPPIMVDGAESVTSMPDVQAQLIKLIVSKSDKDLRVETT